MMESDSGNVGMIIECILYLKHLVMYHGDEISLS